jgi:hypothetical protein
MAVDDWTRAPRCNLVVTVTFEGVLSMEPFYAEINQKVITKKDENGRLLHPEMQQYFESWCGFLFWKWDTNFRIQNHMKFHDDKDLDREVSTQELTSIENYLIYKAFEPKRSPWEVLIIPIYRPDHDPNPMARKSVLIFR